MLYILVAVLVFGFLIFIHELGHFLAAKACGVKVHEFAIGMGPKLIWHRSEKSGTVYSLRMFPIGGFVSMLGENEEQSVEIAEENISEPGRKQSGSLADKPAWQRFIVNAAGAAMNLIFGFAVMAVLAATLTLGSTTVAQIREPQEAGQLSSADYGLMPGDRIIKVNRKRVHIADDLLYAVMSRGAESVQLTVIRDGRELVLDVTFPTIEDSGIVFGDIDFTVKREERTFANIVKHSFYKSVYVVNMVWDSLFGLLSGRYNMNAVSGPVGVAGAISDAAKVSFASLAYITVVISINLGIFNLLPLPALDGGHLLVILIEMIFRRKVPAKVTGIIDAVGLMLLLSLMLIVTVKDVIKLF